VCNRCWRDKNEQACVVLTNEDELHKFKNSGDPNHYLNISVGDLDAAREVIK
jgi:hypothetical protein